MSTRRALEIGNTARRLAYGYLAAAIVLLAVIALKAPDLSTWLWLSLLIIVSLLISLRSALVYLYRKVPSRLNWWLRPTFTEREFDTTWLVYAVVFGAFPLLILFL